MPSHFVLSFLCQSGETVGWVAVVLCTACVAFFLTAILWVLIKAWRHDSKYTFFLSHHKAAAAVFARQLKMMIEEAKPAYKCFLDVDELARLDALAFTVRSDVKNFVVLVTSEVFTRLWCALEIAVAHKNEVPIIPLICWVGIGSFGT